MNILHMIQAPNSRSISQKNGARQIGVYPGEKKKQHFLRVLAAKMANNQLPACTFSTTERIQ